MATIYRRAAILPLSVTLPPADDDWVLLAVVVTVVGLVLLVLGGWLADRTLQPPRFDDPKERQ